MSTSSPTHPSSPSSLSSSSLSLPSLSSSTGSLLQPLTPLSSPTANLPQPSTPLPSSSARALRPTTPNGRLRCQVMAKVRKPGMARHQCNNVAVGDTGACSQVKHQNRVRQLRRSGKTETYARMHLGRSEQTEGDGDGGAGDGEEGKSIEKEVGVSGTVDGEERGKDEADREERGTMDLEEGDAHIEVEMSPVAAAGQADSKKKY